MPDMLDATVTEIPQRLEPVTEDPFAYVAASERPTESKLHRIAELFGPERARRTIVD
jgi:hypothetical protein